MVKEVPLALRLTVALDVDDLTAGWLATLESVALDATGAVDVRREEARGKRAPWAVVLPHASVSERHARLAFGGGRWSVTDVGSTNGTFLNYRQLKQDTPTPLKQGDLLHMGEVVLEVEVLPQPDPDTTTVGEAVDLAASARADGLRARAERATGAIDQYLAQARRRVLKAAGVADPRGRPEGVLDVDVRLVPADVKWEGAWV